MSWRSPKSGSTGGNWYHIPYAYDENENSYAYSETIEVGFWSAMLRLWVATVAQGEDYILCNKVRLKLAQENGCISSLQVHVFDGVDDILIYEGAYPDNDPPDWIEFDLGGTRKICELSVRAKVSGYGDKARVHEADFNQIAVRPLVNGSLAGNSLVGKGLVR